MKVVSVNIGEPKHLFWNQKAYYTSIYKTPTNKKVDVTWDGIIGDKQANLKAHGGVDKAVYAYSANHYTYWENLLGKKIPYGAFGENLTIYGLFESEINIGNIIQIGDVELMAVQPRQPCSKLSLRFDDLTMVKKFWDANKPGIYFRVIKEGSFINGDVVTKVENEDSNISIFDIYRLLNNSMLDSSKLKSLLMINFLPESLKNDLSRLSL